MSENTKALEAPITAPSVAPDFKVILKPEALELRDEYLIEAGEIPQEITSQEMVASAGLVVSKMKGFSKEVEKTREAIKKPYLDAGRTIDAAARNAVQSVEAEITRIEKAMGAYQQEQLRKAREEQARIAREAAAEQERLADLQRQREEAAKSPETAAAAEKLDDEILAASERAAQPKTQAAPVKVQGGSIKPRFVFEVTDLDALYQARPDLVDLKERTADINRLINGPNVIREIPGLIIREEVKVTMRSVSQAEAKFLQ